MEGLQAAPTVRPPAPHAQALLLAAITEALRDRDERSLRRLLARFAEQVTIADLRPLRDATSPGRSGCAEGAVVGARVERLPVAGSAPPRSALPSPVYSADVRLVMPAGARCPGQVGVRRCG
ncbi:hypothetical protein P3T29_006180 [Kitasatospora sp. MAP5-34]|nr:hypothetical protein [Kitasatospora sp. MAP5-34]